MAQAINIINELLVQIYNDILLIEENAFKQGCFSDVSLTEVHTVEAIGMYGAKSMSEVAKELRITVGTLTVAINNLVNKGYVKRFKNENDRRVVNVGLTKKGKLLFRIHKEFHGTMVKNCIEGLPEEEMIVLLKALEKLSTFFKEKYNLIN